MQKHVFDQKRDYDSQTRQKAYLRLSRPMPAKATMLSAVEKSERPSSGRLAAYARIERGIEA